MTPLRLTYRTTNAERDDYPVSRPELYLPLFDDIPFRLGFIWLSPGEYEDADGNPLGRLNEPTGEEKNEGIVAAQAMKTQVDFVIVLAPFTMDRRGQLVPVNLSAEKDIKNVSLRDHVLRLTTEKFRTAFDNLVRRKEHEFLIADIEPPEHNLTVREYIVTRFLTGNPYDPSDLFFSPEGKHGLSGEWVRRSTYYHTTNEFDWDAIKQRQIQPRKENMRYSKYVQPKMRPTVANLLFYESVMIEVMADKKVPFIVIPQELIGAFSG